MIIKEVEIDTLYELIDTLFVANKIAEENNDDKLSLIIFGEQGIGKSKVVESLSKNTEIDFARLPIPQASEFGDVIGKPQGRGGRTEYDTPLYIPIEETKKGIMLLDDINRTNEGMLNGCLNLIQNYETLGWKIPKGWNIIATANPDNGDYSVIPMDDAQLGRSMKCTLLFNVFSWIKYLKHRGVEAELINFVSAEADTIQKLVRSSESSMTSARSILNFFKFYQAISPDERGRNGFIETLCASNCDDLFTNLFMKNHSNRLVDIPNIKEIMCGDWETSKNRLSQHFSSETQRASIGSIIMDRIKAYCNQKDLNEIEEQNLIKILSYDSIPTDLRNRMRDGFLMSKKYASIITAKEVFG